MANTKISALTTWTGNTTGFYVVVDNSGLTQTYKVTKETLGIFQPEIIMKSKNADQSVAVNTNVTFESTDFNLNMTTPDSSTVTLKAGRTYELRGALRLSAGGGSGAEVNYKWYNNTALSYTGITGGAIATDANWAGSDINEALAYVTVGSSDISVLLRVTAVSGGPLISATQSRMSIKRVA
jgi:hypothetical protein